EQRSIVNRYKAIENRIANNKQTIAKLEEAAQALYRKMFVDGIDVNNLPDGWRMGTIEDISEKIVAGTIPKYDDTSSYMVLGQKCNKNGILDLNLCKRHIPKDNCIFLQKKDILVNSTGDGTLGRVGQIWFDPENLAFDSNMTLVRPLNGYSEYLGCVLLNKQDYFVQISQGSTNQTRLYCSMIKPVPLIIPSDIILYDFSKEIRPMKEHEYLLYKENEKLTEMLSVVMA
ncbi:MAG: restriction endonuclease subunit S, partial [Paludibacteraceae bacterium]|nr:restriction endonuclease subunit S [Paludibacteraceae bacterium]